MGIANKYNKGTGFNYTLPKDVQYKSLKELFTTGGDKAVYTVKAIYINTKSHYGNAPVVATNDFLVNLPHHMLDTVKEMLTDEEVYQQVNNDGLGFSVYEYNTNKNKGIFYSIRWIDIEK